jgi:hypothetical protein
MLKKLLPLIFLFAVFQANAQVITTTSDYAGFYTDLKGPITTPFSAAHPVNGYDNMAAVTGEADVYYSNFDHVGSWSHRLGPAYFTLNSLFIGAAWGNIDAVIAGYLDDVVIYSKDIKLTISPTDLLLDWTGIDQFTVTRDISTFVATQSTCTALGCNQATYGSFRINEALTPATVPEPSIIALFGLGLVGIGFARRRQS